MPNGECNIINVYANLFAQSGATVIKADRSIEGTGKFVVLWLSLFQLLIMSHSANVIYHSFVGQAGRNKAHRAHANGNFKCLSTFFNLQSIPPMPFGAMAHSQKMRSFNYNL